MNASVGGVLAQLRVCGRRARGLLDDATGLTDAIRHVDSALGAWLFGFRAVGVFQQWLIIRVPLGAARGSWAFRGFVQERQFQFSPRAPRARRGSS